MKFNIIGSGTWGITFANLLVKNNNLVTVLHRSSENSLSLIKNGKHPRLPNMKISEKINYTDDFSSLDLKNINVLALPANEIDIFFKINNFSNSKILLLCKGIDINHKLLISQLIKDKHNITKDNIAVLSGPNHAEEILKNKPTTSIIASTNKIYREQLQNQISSTLFRLYTSSDINGVQVGAAVKNVIAIASGICFGLNLGDNTQASLVSRGLNEILELSKVFRFNDETIYGLSGLGDLICTSYSNHSRNRKLGILISKGKNLNKSKSEVGMISEGIYTSKVLFEIINKYNLDMPICREVYNIIYKNYNPKDSILKLMNRSLKDEK